MKNLSKLAVLGMLFYGILQTASAQFFLDEDYIPDWAEVPVENLTKKGIIKGSPDGKFYPARPINRAEFCKVLVQATETKMVHPNEPSFTDVPGNTWFFEPTETAREFGWVSGYPDGTFLPANNINRAEVAKILVNAFGYEAVHRSDDPQWYEKYIRVMENHDLLPHDITRANFEPSHYPSRAEIAEQIYRFMIRKDPGIFEDYDVVDREVHPPAFKNLITPFSHPYDNLYYRFSIKIPDGYWFRHFPESQKALTELGFSSEEFETVRDAQFWMRVLKSENSPKKLMEKNDGQTLTIEFPRSDKSYFQITGPVQYSDAMWSVYGSLKQY